MAIGAVLASGCVASRSGFGPFRAFGEYLEKLRVRRPARSQSNAARQAAKSGLSLVKQGKLSELERGWNSNPDPELFRQLSALYGVPYQTVVREWLKVRYKVDAPEMLTKTDEAPTTAPHGHGTHTAGVIGRRAAESEFTESEPPDDLSEMVKALPEDDRAVLRPIIERFSRTSRAWRMRSAVVAVVAGSLILAASAEAQVCLGAPSLRERHVRVGGGLWGTSDQFGYEAFVTAGRDFFGTFSIGRSEYDPWDDPTTEIGIAAGYDFPAAAGRVSICPRASVGWELGPDNILDTGTDFNAFSTSAGVSAGVLATSPGTRIGVIPYLSLGVAHRRTELSGFFEQEQSDTYGRIGIGVGLQNGRALIRPWLSVPFSTDGSGPASFGVNASFQF